MDISKEISKLAGRILQPVRSGKDTLASAKEGTAPELHVSTRSFPEGGRIPERYAGEAAVAPELQWTGVPRGTQEIVVLCEDPDAPLPKPFVHWALYGIPPSATSLPESIEPGAAVPGGAQQGKNSLGKDGFTGPKPPPGHGVHHYHFQVFALDTRLPLGAGADRDALVDAMQGHVIAAGESVGTYEVN